MCLSNTFTWPQNHNIDKYIIIVINVIMELQHLFGALLTL